MNFLNNVIKYLYCSNGGIDYLYLILFGPGQAYFAIMAEGHTPERNG